MGKLEEFLLKNAGAGTDEMDVAVSARFVGADGKMMLFKVRAITEAENKAIRKGCQKTSLNKKTRLYETVTDVDRYSSALAVACVTQPNLKSAELQAAYGVMGAEELLDVLLRPGEYAALLQAVQQVNGMDETLREMADEAKN